MKGQNVLKRVWEGLAEKYKLNIVPTGRNGTILDDYANAVLWKLVTDFVKNNRGYDKDTDPPAPVNPPVPPASPASPASPAPPAPPAPPASATSLCLRSAKSY